LVHPYASRETGQGVIKFSSSRSPLAEGLAFFPSPLGEGGAFHGFNPGRAPGEGHLERPEEAAHLTARIP
jgi:hypothetical protein